MNDQFEHRQIWDPLTRIWHWLLVITVVSGWLLGEYRNFTVMQWHMYMGYSTGVLLCIKLVWGFAGPPAVRFRTLFYKPSAIIRYAGKMFKREPSGTAGHNPLGALSVLLMLIALAVQVITGLFADDDALFYSGPLASYVSNASVLTLTSVHDTTSRIVLVLVATHLAAIIFYYFWKRENLVTAMINGKKLVRKENAD